MTDAIEAARRIVVECGRYETMVHIDALTVARALLAIAEPTQDIRERAQEIFPTTLLLGIPTIDEYMRQLRRVESALTTAHAEGRAAQRREDAEIIREREEYHAANEAMAEAAEYIGSSKYHGAMSDELKKIAAAIEGGGP